MEPRVAFCRNRNGRRLATMTWGDGPVLIVPPGWVSHLELQWQLLGMHDFYARLAQSFQLVFYDRRGVGLSDRARDDFSLDGEVDDIEVVIDHVTDGPVSLLGVSQGGPIAIRYAARHPERVRHLVLFGAYHIGRDAASPELQATLVALVRASWGVASRTLAGIFVPDDPTFRDRFARFQREATDRDTAAALLAAVYEWDVSGDLARVRAPTLVIHRRDDRAMLSRFGLEIAAGIKGAQLVMMEGSIHFPWLGDWEPIVSLVEDFVGVADSASVSRFARGVAPPAIAEHPVPRAEPIARQVLHYRVGDDDERSACRVGLAQLGEEADQPQPAPDGLFRLPPQRVEPLIEKLRASVERAGELGADLLLFPEMLVDLGYAEIEREMLDLAHRHRMMLVAGGHHDPRTRANTAVAFGPEGVLWRQRKHIPAVLRLEGVLVEEPIVTPASPVHVLASTPLGRIAIATCRDFLDLDLRVALKNAEPTVEIVLNPAFSPVTADFEAAHFEARRSLYACMVFCNFAVFGGSRIQSPEKIRPTILRAGEERVEVIEVPLLAMRAERRAWDERARARFIQSTRH